MDEAERRAALAAMKTVVAEPYDVPAPARDGVRWSDVWDAVYWASYDVDMAIVRSRSERDGDRIVFDLVTTRDEPGTLVVDRAPPPEGIDAVATVGTFGQRTDEARRLVERVKVRLVEFGRKPGFE